MSTFFSLFWQAVGFGAGLIVMVFIYRLWKLMVRAARRVSAEMREQERRRAETSAMIAEQRRANAEARRAVQNQLRQERNTAMALGTPRSDWQIRVLHNQEGTADKFYAVRIDFVEGINPYRVVAAWGPARGQRAQSNQDKGNYETLSAAQRQVETLIRKKQGGGYVDVEAGGYTGWFTVQAAINMVDATRLYGYAVTAETVRAGPRTTRVVNRVEQPAPRAARQESSRASRDLNL